MAKRISTLTFIEGRTVTGPIKPLFSFQRFALSPEGRASGWMVEPCIVTTGRGSPSTFEANGFVEAARALELRIEVLRERRAPDWTVLGKFVDLIERYRPDIVESHSYKPHLLVALARAKTRRRFRWIAFHHGYTEESIKVRAYNQIDRWTLPRADRVITFCRPFAEQLARRGVSREAIDIIKNPIEATPQLSPHEADHTLDALKLTTRDFIVLAVGRLAKEKGHEQFVQAAKMLVSEVPDASFKFVIVGDGGERRRLEALAQPLGDRLVFTGYRDYVTPFYGAASVFVLPSYSEGSPLVLLEAMQAGLAIVATEIGGVPEMVAHDQSALLVPPGNPASIAGAVRRLYFDAGLRSGLGKAARGAAATFSVQQYYDRLMGIYDRVLSRAHGS